MNEETIELVYWSQEMGQMSLHHLKRQGIVGELTDYEEGQVSVQAVHTVLDWIQASYESFLRTTSHFKPKISCHSSSNSNLRHQKQCL
jgi:hypothetical protein